VNISLRLPAELINRLKKSARDNNHGNLSREIATRLRGSLHYKKQQDPAVRALCYLISETAKHVAPSSPDIDPRIHWRSNPFYYAAFKVAVDRILDTLKPPGEIRAPTFKFDQELDEFMTDFVEDHKSPDRLGVRTADLILEMFKRIPAMTVDEREQFRDEKERLVAEAGLPPGLIADVLYAMPDAARDLAIKPRDENSGATVARTVTWKW